MSDSEHLYSPGRVAWLLANHEAVATGRFPTDADALGQPRAKRTAPVAPFEAAIAVKSDLDRALKSLHPFARSVVVRYYRLDQIERVIADELGEKHWRVHQTRRAAIATMAEYLGWTPPGNN